MEKKYVANKVLCFNEAGQVLLTRDSGVGDHANSKGVWDVPGGRMEHGETPKEALRREVFEELGVTIDPETAHPVHVDIWGVKGDVENEPIIGIFYAVSIQGAEVKLSDEHTEFQWFDLDGDFPEEVKKAVLDALKDYKMYKPDSH